MENKWGLDLSYSHVCACPRCRRNGKDSAGDNLTVYGEGNGAYCHACQFTILSEDQKRERGLDVEQDYEEEEVSTREPITEEENAAIKKYTSTKSKGWRGIRDDTNVPYGVRYSYDEETGQPDKQFVPTTIAGKLVGYKTREFPKDFTNPLGVVGKDCELIGQFRYKNGGRTILIVGGEVDMLSAYQMLADYQESKGYDPIPVVSPSVGETGCAKQVQAQYEFFNTFDKIIVGFDNDDAGREATEKVVAVLPKGKVYVAQWTKKDPNAMLTAGMEKVFINDYYRAKAYVPAGIVGSGELSNKVREEANAERIAFPPFMDQVNQMTGGGIGLGKIVNIGAASGIGKTVYVDESIYFWIFNSPYRVGVVSMELSAGQYGLSMLSRHVGRKINNIAEREERMAFLNSPDVVEAERNLYYREDGTHRFHLVDDRDGSIEALKAVVEQLVVACECKVIVLDPIQDILDGLTNEDQAVFLKWQKGMIKSHNITFININHVRKSSGGGKQNSSGAMISEEDFAGSSTIFKSGALNILLVRDKMNDDPIIRNTTQVYISKNRDNGATGPAGEVYYDNNTHKLYDLHKWMTDNGA
jgi:hypothetical protein